MAGKYPNRKSVLTPERIEKLEERELRMLCDRIFYSSNYLDNIILSMWFFFLISWNGLVGKNA